MSTEKLIIYGVAAYIAYSVIRRKGLSVSGGVNVGGVRRTNSQAQETQTNVRTALDLAYGIKGLFGGGARTDKPGGTVGIDESLDQGRESVISYDDLTNTDTWAANPYNGY